MEQSEDKMIEKKKWEKPEVTVIDFKKTTSGGVPLDTEDSAYNLESS
jgi:hypothetical protein